TFDRMACSVTRDRPRCSPSGPCWFDIIGPFSSPVPSSLSTCYARIDVQFDAPIVVRGKRGIRSGRYQPLTESSRPGAHRWLSDVTGKDKPVLIGPRDEPNGLG